MTLGRPKVTLALLEVTLWVCQNLLWDLLREKRKSLQESLQAFVESLRASCGNKSFLSLVAEAPTHSCGEEVKGRLCPLHVGCVSHLGAEISTHTLRQWCARDAATGKAPIAFNCSNAFASVSRAAALGQF